YFGFLLGPPAIGGLAELIGLPAGHGLVVLLCALIAALGSRPPAAVRARPPGGWTGPHVTRAHSPGFSTPPSYLSRSRHGARRSEPSARRRRSRLTVRPGRSTESRSSPTITGPANSAPISARSAS